MMNRIKIKPDGLSKYLNGDKHIKRTFAIEIKAKNCYIELQKKIWSDNFETTIEEI